MKRTSVVICIVLAIAGRHITSAAPNRITLANGKSFELNLPQGFAISVAAQGLKRVRFMARSPDNRIFVTDMYGARVLSDVKFNLRNRKFDCRRVPVAHTRFPAHSSPLGLEYFDSTSHPALANSFLVALHGSTKKGLRRGYSVVRIDEAKSGSVETSSPASSTARRSTAALLIFSVSARTPFS